MDGGEWWGGGENGSGGRWEPDGGRKRQLGQVGRMIGGVGAGGEGWGRLYWDCMYFHWPTAGNLVGEVKQITHCRF